MEAAERSSSSKKGPGKTSFMDTLYESVTQEDRDMVAEATNAGPVNSDGYTLRKRLNAGRKKEEAKQKNAKKTTTTTSPAEKKKKMLQEKKNKSVDEKEAVDDRSSVPPKKAFQLRRIREKQPEKKKNKKACCCCCNVFMCHGSACNNSERQKKRALMILRTVHFDRLKHHRLSITIITTWRTTAARRTLPSRLALMMMVVSARTVVEGVFLP